MKGPGVYGEALKGAHAAALEAGALLRQEMSRPGGPRGDRQKAPIDAEVEVIIHRRLTEAHPGWGFRAEERPDLHRPPAASDGPFWLVDPNDGTSAFFTGLRGASVSIGLIHQGRPVLGVVYAYAWPDDAGTLYAWAEGHPLTVDGAPLSRPPWPERLSQTTVVLVSHYADRKAQMNAWICRPARFRPVPGIAHRMARAAVGEGALAVSLYGAWDYDCAAGHALLRGAGGTLLDADGQEAGYSATEPRRYQACFGGGSAVSQEMASVDLADRLDGYRDLPRIEVFAHPLQACRVEEPARVDRAMGAWLGWLIGTALNRTTQASGRLPRLTDSQTSNQTSNMAGQPNDVGVIGIQVARALIAGADPVAAAVDAIAHLEALPPDSAGSTHDDKRGHRLQAHEALQVAFPLVLANQMALVGALLEAVGHPGLEVAPLEALQADLNDPDLPDGAPFNDEALSGSDEISPLICAQIGVRAGRRGLPLESLRTLLTARPIEGLPHVHRPVPPSGWPVDAEILGERLLLLADGLP